MGPFLIIALVVWLATKSASDAKLDHTYAKQGGVSPRLKAKYGSREEANRRVGKYGIFSHLADAWNDYWPRRTDALMAARDARPIGTRRAQFRARLGAGREAVTNYLAERPKPTPPRHSADGDRNPIRPHTVTSDVAPPADDWQPDDWHWTADQADQPEPMPAALNQTNGGITMTGPTGEAANYETALATIDAMIAEVRGQVDSATFALTKMAEAKAAVDAMQQSYRPTAQAAQTKLDQLASLGLDATTMGHAGTTVDALPVGAVDNLYDQMENVEQLTRERLMQAELALSALNAERGHIVDTYGDAHATVAGNLGGDSRFISSGGGASASGGSAAGSTNGPGVYNEPVDARGGHFGSGNVYNAPAPAGAGGQGQPAKATNNNTFNDKVDASNSSWDDEDVVNN